MAFAALTVFLALSCSPAKPSPPAVPGPEKVFADLQAAIGRKDWRSCLQCVDPRDHDAFLVAVNMDAAIALMNRKKGQPGYTEILTRHGVSASVPKESVNLADLDKMKELLVKPY